ncbi:MAG TPA: alpha/beta hydrolase, partial [Vicinamibacteria bacterium]|nr:alpha/beta hydrolase [Vicinamibacteria bacterium]
QMDAACGAAYPDLRGEWRHVLERLDRQPVRVSRHAPGGKDGDTVVEIRRGPFAEAFRNLLATTSGQKQVPFLVHRAAAGDFAPFVAMLPRDSTLFAVGLYLSVTCAEGTARIRPADVPRLTAGTFLGDYRVRRQQAACAEWPAPAVPADFFLPPSSDVPVLVVSGTMDYVTPPLFAQQLCGSLTNCRLLSVPSLGHGPFDLDRWQGGGCLDRVVNAFYAQPQPATLDASCIERMRPPEFTMPSAP